MGSIYLVRHAQASFGSSNYDQLSELGREQSAHLGSYFGNFDEKFDQVITGSLVRHKQTLDGILNNSNEDQQM